MTGCLTVAGCDTVTCCYLSENPWTAGQQDSALPLQASHYISCMLHDQSWCQLCQQYSLLKATRCCVSGPDNLASAACAQSYFNLACIAGAVVVEPRRVRRLHSACLYIAWTVQQQFSTHVQLWGAFFYLHCHTTMACPSRLTLLRVHMAPLSICCRHFQTSVISLAFATLSWCTYTLCSCGHCCLHFQASRLADQYHRFPHPTP